eukprot:gene25943-biopygen1439
MSRGGHSVGGSKISIQIARGPFGNTPAVVHFSSSNRARKSSIQNLSTSCFTFTPLMLTLLGQRKYGETG